MLDRLHADFDGLRTFFDNPVLPDAASRSRLNEITSALFTEKCADCLQLGVEESRKSYAEHEALGKKAVLFVMVDDTRNCDVGW